MGFLCRLALQKGRFGNLEVLIHTLTLENWRNNRKFWKFSNRLIQNSCLFGEGGGGRWRGRSEVIIMSNNSSFRLQKSLSNVMKLRIQDIKSQIWQNFPQYKACTCQNVLMLSLYKLPVQVQTGRVGVGPARKFEIMTQRPVPYRSRHWACSPF